MSEDQPRGASSWLGAVAVGAGLAFFIHAGPLGIRLDVGDEIYGSNGAHNNLRVTFGPTLRF